MLFIIPNEAKDRNPIRYIIQIGHGRGEEKICEPYGRALSDKFDFQLEIPFYRNHNDRFITFFS